MVYKRPTELRLVEDVPAPCNVLLMGLPDSGFLMSGALLAARHARSLLINEEPVTIPASVTIYAQLAEVRTGDIQAGEGARNLVRTGALDAYRWLPADGGTGRPLRPRHLRPLSAPVPVWHFSLVDPPGESEAKEVDLETTAAGDANAVVYWMDVQLFGDVRLATGGPAAAGEGGVRWADLGAAPGGRGAPRPPTAGPGPALQYLPGTMRLRESETVPLHCSHNTVRLAFALRSGDCVAVPRRELCLSHALFSRAADVGLTRAYSLAIEKVPRASRPPPCPPGRPVPARAAPRAGTRAPGQRPPRLARPRPARRPSAA